MFEFFVPKIKILNQNWNYKTLKNIHFDHFLGEIQAFLTINKFEIFRLIEFEKLSSMQVFPKVDFLDKKRRFGTVCTSMESFDESLMYFLLYYRKKKKKSKSDKMSTVEEDENEDTGITIKVHFLIIFMKSQKEGFISFSMLHNFFRLLKYHKMAFVL